MISIDTLRADHVGCYGARRAHTPTLDSIAQEGVRFARTLSATPLTLPSHTSLLTGLDPPRHGVRNNATFRLSEEVPTLAQHFAEAGFATAAFVGAVVLDRQYGLARGFDVYNDEMSPRLAAGDHGFTERTADQVVDATLLWLDAAPSRFFLWVHVYDPHANYKPPQGFLAAFPGDPYAGEIAFTDAEIGRLLEAVRSRWPDERTLVVVTSDHGEGRGEHGEFTHGHTVYDSTQHIPLLMAGPGLPPGEVVEATTRLVDVAPTILGLAGLDPMPDMDGADLRPLLGAGKADGRLAYVETLATQLDFGWSPLLGVSSDDFKYIRAPRPELYDLREDPRETRNVAAERPGVAAELDGALEARLTRARPVVSFLRPDAEERARLQQLGYVASVAMPEDGELGRVGGADPKDQLPVIQALLEAMRLLHEGRASEALEHLEPLPPGGPVLDLFRADFARASGQAELAERYARAAIAQAPDRSDLRRSLGSALEDQGRLDEAWAAFEEAERLDAASGEPLVGMGRVAEARGERNRAAQLYQEAAKRRGASAEALWRLAALRLEEGSSSEAERLLDQVPPDALATPNAALRLAEAETSVGLEAQARERLAEARRTAPEDPALQQAYDALGGDG